MKNNVVYTIKDPVSIHIPTAFKEMHSIANDIIEKQAKEPGVIQISHLATIEPYTIEVISYSLTDFAYFIRDPRQKPELILAFANKLP